MIKLLPRTLSLPFMRRWAAGMAAILVERGVLSGDDIEAELGPRQEDTTVRCVWRLGRSWGRHAAQWQRL